ncbi:MAG: ATP synthase F0 subunit C [Terriglobales bacterium]
MRLRLMYLFATLSAFLFATSPLLAQGASGAGSAVKLGAVGMGIASGICGIGQGLATKGAAEGMARNPGAVAHVRFALIFGIVMIESLALYTFVIALMKL